MQLPLVDFVALAHYEWLQIPAWVFEPVQARMHWANAAGLAFWQAATLDDLRARDFSDVSRASSARMLASMKLHGEGRVVRESWTLYPRGLPLTSMLVSRGVRLPDGGQAILFASEPLAASYDPAMLRGIEAMQHTSVRVAMHSLDDGRALMRNPAALAAFGPAELAEGEGDLFHTLFAQSELPGLIAEQVRQGHSFSDEVLLNTLDGPRWHALDVRPVHDPVTGHAVLQLNARDISDLRAALSALESARDAAEAANRAKSAFLASMSHEIRTPMNAVLGLTELLLGTPLNAKQRHFLELTQSSARGLMQIINDILDLSKIEANKLTIDSAPVALRSLLRDALAPMQIQAGTRALALLWRVDDDVPEMVLADAARLRQVLHNLVGNAVKFTESGQVDVGLHVRERERGRDRLLLGCTVTDTGIGMSEEQLAQVFEPFTQADSGITRRYGGTGLGLSIVQRLAQLMGGGVQVHSQLGVGSRSSFSFAVSRQPPGG